MMSVILIKDEFSPLIVKQKPERFHFNYELDKAAWIQKIKPHNFILIAGFRSQKNQFLL